MPNTQDNLEFYIVMGRAGIENGWMDLRGRVQEILPDDVSWIFQNWLQGTRKNAML